MIKELRLDLHEAIRRNLTLTQMWYQGRPGMELGLSPLLAHNGESQLLILLDTGCRTDFHPNLEVMKYPFTSLLRQHLRSTEESGFFTFPRSNEHITLWYHGERSPEQLEIPLLQTLRVSSFPNVSVEAKWGTWSSTFPTQ